MSANPANPANPKVFKPWALSDYIYNTPGNDTDKVIDRLCQVVQVLVQRQPRDVQVQVLQLLEQETPTDPNQEELFA